MPEIRHSRRQTFWWLLALTLGTIVFKFGNIALSYMTPPKRKNSYGGLVEAGSISDLPPMGSPPIHIPKGRFWLIHDEVGITALHSSCTHLECRFTWDSRKMVFVCPCHGSEFARNGEVLKGPAKRALDRFALKLINDQGIVIRSAQQQSAEAIPVQDLLHLTETEVPHKDMAKVQERLFIQVDTSRKISVTPASSTL